MPQPNPELLLLLTAAKGDDERLGSARFSGQREASALQLQITIEPAAANVESVDEHGLDLVVAQVGHVEAEETEGWPADIVFITPAHDVQRSRLEVDDGSAQDSPFAVNRGGLEIVQVVSRDRNSQPSRGEERPVVRVKSKDGVVHGCDVNDVVRSTGDLNVRGKERSALDFAIDPHGELLVELIRVGADICGREDCFNSIYAGSILVIAPLSDVDLCERGQRAGEYESHQRHTRTPGPRIRRVCLHVLAPLDRFGWLNTLTDHSTRTRLTLCCLLKQEERLYDGLLSRLCPGLAGLSAASHCRNALASHSESASLNMQENFSYLDGRPNHRRDCSAHMRP